MRINSELCHVSSDKIIVKVSASNKEFTLGSALGEGVTVKEAEDNAINSLTKRLKDYNDDYKAKDIKENHNESIAKFSEANIKKTESILHDNKILNPQHTQEGKESDTPLDWSNEISEVESLLRKLKWPKDQEDIFIQKLIGSKNRSSITEYSDIVLLIWLLKDATNLDSYDDIDNYYTREVLIDNNNKLINKLGWSQEKARDLLSKEFKKKSRIDLELKELLMFNMLLDRTLKI